MRLRTVSIRLAAACLTASLLAALAAPAARPQSAPAAAPKPAARTEAPAATTATSPAAPKLDLYPRDVRSLLSASEWLELERQGRDQDEEIATADNVRVEDFRPAPNVPRGIASIFWAARHPLQAWRVFAPVPP